MFVTDFWMWAWKWFDGRKTSSRGKTIAINCSVNPDKLD